MGARSIHNLGLVGHIEDIVVNKDQQGKKLGLRIIEALDYIAERIGCYKVCLLLQYITQIISRSQLSLRESQVDHLLVVYC